jgi:hypothetical protein
MRHIAPVLSIFVLTAAAFAKDGPDEASARIAALERENLALKRETAALRSRVHELFAELAGRTHTVRHVIPFDGEPEPEHLRGIELAEMPSGQDVRFYVASILRASVRHRNAYGADDPEVRLLEKVGSGHVGILLEPLLYADRPNADMYLVEAIKVLAREEHKEIVLRSLPVVRDLVQVVQARGWTEEATPILLAALADRRSWTLPNPGLPTEWIDAVAGLARPETYDDLKTYFHYGANRYWTWTAIRRLPGIDLGAQVEQLWGWARKLDDAWERINLAAVAAHYGHKDALGVLFEEPDDWPNWDVIEAVTPYRGSRAEPERAKEWFEAHKDRLVFDAALGKYRLPE